MVLARLRGLESDFAMNGALNAREIMFWENWVVGFEDNFVIRHQCVFGEDFQFVMPDALFRVCNGTAALFCAPKKRRFDKTQ